MSQTGSDEQIVEWKAKTCRDVVVGDEHASPNVTNLDLSTEAGRFRAVFVRTQYLWPAGTNITFNFIGNPVGKYQGTPIQQDKVATVIKEWEQYADVHFVRIPDRQPAQIRISFNPYEGSYSYVGTQALRIPAAQNTMNLGWIEKGKEITAEDKGVILHEFGHLLGMLHEHQSPNRDASIKFDLEALYAYFGQPPNNWSRQDVDQQIVNVYSKKSVSNFSEFSKTSIMEYDFPAEIFVGGEAIARNQVLNDLDKAYMRINYPKVGDKESLVAALATVGCEDGELKDRILKAKNASTIRYWFGIWSMEKQAATANFGETNV